MKNDCNVVAYGNANSKDEIFSIFKFVADNSDVEWSLHKFKDNSNNIGYQLGTYGFGGRLGKDYGRCYSPGLQQGFGMGATHSHPGDLTIKDQLESMWGDERVGSQYKNMYNNPIYQTYFPATGKMREIQNDGKPSKPFNFRKL